MPLELEMLPDESKLVPLVDVELVNVKVAFEPAVAAETVKFAAALNDAVPLNLGHEMMYGESSVMTWLGVKGISKGPSQASTPLTVAIQEAYRASLERRLAAAV